LSKTEKVFKIGRINPKKVEIRDVQEKDIQYSLSSLKSFSNLKRKIQTIQRYIKNLEKFKQIKDLETEFRASFKKSSKFCYRRGSYFNLSSNYKKIKLSNIPLFNLEFSIRQRDE